MGGLWRVATSSALRVQDSSRREWIAKAFLGWECELPDGAYDDVFVALTRGEIARLDLQRAPRPFCEWRMAFDRLSTIGKKRWHIIDWRGLFNAFEHALFRPTYHGQNECSGSGEIRSWKGDVLHLACAEGHWTVGDEVVAATDLTARVWRHVVDDVALRACPEHPRPGPSER